MRIYRPIKTNKQTQDFGERKACIKTNIWGRPVFPQRIIGKNHHSVCPVGYIDLYTQHLRMKGHNGMDLKTWRGEPLYFPVDANTDWWGEATADIGVRLDVYSLKRVHIPQLPKEAGPQAQKEWKENNGWVYVKLIFAHLKDIEWPTEDKKTMSNKGREEYLIKFGWRIGWCNNTGASSGDHLHWSWKIVSSTGETLDNLTNGYKGALPFDDMYENVYVGKVLKIKEQALSAIELARKLIFQFQELLLALSTR